MTGLYVFPSDTDPLVTMPVVVGHFFLAIPLATFLDSLAIKIVPSIDTMKQINNVGFFIFTSGMLTF